MIEKDPFMFNIDLETLREALSGSTPVHFSYFKKDGTLRNATGTLNEGLIPEEMKPKDASINCGNNLKYYDLEKSDWRSLCIDCSLVIIIE
jgi:hypothetical protein